MGFSYNKFSFFSSSSSFMFLLALHNLWSLL
jgi:hypothetical protein